MSHSLGFREGQKCTLCVCVCACVGVCVCVCLCVFVQQCSQPFGVTKVSKVKCSYCLLQHIFTSNPLRVIAVEMKKSSTFLLQKWYESVKCQREVEQPWTYLSTLICNKYPLNLMISWFCSLLSTVITDTMRTCFFYLFKKCMWDTNLTSAFLSDKKIRPEPFHGNILTTFPSSTIQKSNVTLVHKSLHTPDRRTTHAHTRQTNKNKKNKHYSIWRSVKNVQSRSFIKSWEQNACNAASCMTSSAE